MPFYRSGSKERFLIPVELNTEGAEATGLKTGLYSIQYSHAPILEPSTQLVAGASFKVFGVNRSDSGKHGKGPEMYGRAAIVGGTFGKGRVFVTSVHPEFFENSRVLVRGGFRFITGRDIALPVRQRTPRAYTVGYYSVYPIGVETAKTMLAIDENKDNVIGAFALSQLMYFMSYEELKAELESGAPYLQHPLCDQAKQQLKSLELRAPGTMFKDIVENDTTGVSHHLSEYVGKGDYVLVDFWASWCGPCMQEMPNVKANYEKYKDKGFKVVDLSFDRNADAWKKAIREHYLNWIHLSDLKFWQTVAAETYGIRSIPSSILCDPTGKIVDIDLRGEKLGAKLMEIYGE
jgi:thiol-disulfide isomerase/thioredoxin